MTVYFISGIDTDVGKTFATGMFARYLAKNGRRVITQKMVQTGVSGTLADDILVHRKLMGIEPLPCDHSGETCPLVFRMPASPHLAAEREGTVIDLSRIDVSTRRLLDEFDIILLEGAGGLHVPLTQECLIADYVQQRQYPLVLVTSGKLGSINHTLLTLESAAHRNIPIAGLVYNHAHATDAVIRDDSIRYFKNTLKKYGREGAFVEMPTIDLADISDIDFSPLLL